MDRRSILVVMGVAGSGKTTVGQLLATRLGWTYAEADDFHPPSNLAKMASGAPLTTEDRLPWLRAVGTWIDDRTARGEPGVVTCSALRREYRDLLRRPQVRFIHLRGDRELIAQRMAGRSGHFFKPALLESQFGALEDPSPDEGALTVTIDRSPSELVEHILTALSDTSSPWPE